MKCYTDDVFVYPPYSETILNACFMWLAAPQLKIHTIPNHFYVYAHLHEACLQC